MDKEDLKYIEQGLLVCGIENELNEELHKATPYMLRNDGKCFECKGWHPYISNIYDDENDLDSLINERLWELKWYYDNSLVSDVKKYIEILVKSCCEKDMNFKKDKQELFNTFNIKEDTYTCRDDNELYSILNNINNLTNQEFCKVRTSNVKIGGDSNDIYFRISSIGFNWFNIIWKFVMDNVKDISSVTISRDTRVRDFTQGECYKVNGVEINHLPTDEFLTLRGNPIIEAFNSKLNVINEALPKLASGKSLSDAYPNLHPKDVNGFYKKQISEELAWDIENILQPINKNILNEKFANNIDKDILNIIKDPKSETNFSKCSKSAAIRLVIAYNNPKYKDIKLCLGYFSPKGDEGVNNINHAWVEIDGKTYESNVPSGDYKRVLVDELTIDRDEDLYNQVEEFLNKSDLREYVVRENVFPKDLNEDPTTNDYYRYEILEDDKLVGGLFKGYVDILSKLEDFLPSYDALFDDIGKQLPKPDINYDGYDSNLIRSAFTKKGIEQFENALKIIKNELNKNNIKLIKKKVNPDEDAIIYSDDYQIVYYDDMANVEPLQETQKLYNIKEYYHGTPSKELNEEINSTLWFTNDIIYAMRYGENIFTCDLSVNNPLNVGDTNKYIRGLMPNTFSQEFIDIAKALNVEPKKLLHIDEDARKIYTIVRTKEFKDLCIKNGYDAIQTIEDDSMCYGIFDLNQIKVNDIDLG